MNVAHSTVHPKVLPVQGKSNRFIPVCTFRADRTNLPNYHMAETTSLLLCLASVEKLLVSSLETFFHPKGLFIGVAECK